MRSNIVTLAAETIITAASKVQPSRVDWPSSRKHGRPGQLRSSGGSGDLAVSPADLNVQEHLDRDSRNAIPYFRNSSTAP